MEKSIIYTKSYDLTISVYRKVAELKRADPENELLGWFFEDISAISLNLYLANEYNSKRSFLIKLYTAKRSAVRSQFWVELIKDLGELSEEDAAEYSAQLTDILKMVSASITTMNKKSKEKKVAD